MYKRQFKKWGLKKYMTSTEKFKHIQTIGEFDDAAMSSVRHDRLPGLGAMELRKLLRYIKTELRERTKTQSGYSNERAEVLYNTELLEDVALCSDSSAISAATPAYTLDESMRQRLYSSMIHSESPFLTNSGLARANSEVDIQILLRSVQISCSYYTPNVSQSSVAAAIFWDNMQNAVYFFRINSYPRALEALNNAYESSEGALLTPDICSFIRKLLATLSPVNTRACPYIRHQIILRLTGTAWDKLGQYHPITILLQQLRFDTATREVSEICLAYMVEITTSGQDQSMLRTAINAQLSISRLMRKDGEFDNAMRIAEHAYGTALVSFGQTSLEACLALRQQEHICIDIASFERALNICFLIMNQAGSDLLEVRIHTAEDIAHIYEQLGDMEKRAEWLHQAKEAACLLWGDCVATQHIMDKQGGFIARPLVT
jgi:tetratricopeptide (TPR) repeat protein